MFSQAHEEGSLKATGLVLGPAFSPFLLHGLLSSLIVASTTHGGFCAVSLSRDGACGISTLKIVEK